MIAQHLLPGRGARGDACVVEVGALAVPELHHVKAPRHVNMNQFVKYKSQLTLCNMDLSEPSIAQPVQGSVEEKEAPKK